VAFLERLIIMINPYRCECNVGNHVIEHVSF
jgi:hypothetical protein